MQQKKQKENEAVKVNQFKIIMTVILNSRYVITVSVRLVICLLVVFTSFSTSAWPRRFFFHN